MIGTVWKKTQNGRIARRRIGTAKNPIASVTPIAKLAQRPQTIEPRVDNVAAQMSGHNSTVVW